MAKFKYTWKTIPRDGDGVLCTNEVNWSEYGENGWELVGFKEDRAFFKRPYDGAEDELYNLNCKISCIASELEKVINRETVLVSLMQDLVEKFYPESPALISLKEALKPFQEDAEKEKMEELHTQKVGFCLEHIENAMENYKEEDSSLNLLAIFAADGEILGLGAERCRNMIEAIYCYYNNNNQNEKIEECYVKTLKRMAFHFSSNEDVKVLQQRVSLLTPNYGATLLFESLITELDNEQNGTSPFKIDTIGEMIETYVTQVKQDAELSTDAELLAEINKYIEQIQQKYGIECCC